MWRGMPCIVCMCVLVSAGGCSFLFNRPWRGAADFVNGLQCRMSKEEVKEEAEGFPGLEILETDPHAFVANKKNTQVELWFEDDELQAFKVSWVYPVTNYGTDFKTNICTGQRFVHVKLFAPGSIAGAPVLLDGEKVGEISSAGTMSMYVPLGTHRLTVARRVLDPWVRELSYDESSFPVDRLEVD